MANLDALFQPFAIKNVTLHNRVGDACAGRNVHAAFHDAPRIRKDP